MIIRVPPSLNWLIKKYAYLNHELNKCETKFFAAHEEYRKVSEDLNALKKVMAMHELAFPPEHTPPSPKYRKILHGETTRLIYKALSSDRYMSTEEVFMSICKSLSIEFEPRIARKEYRVAIRNRLKTLT